MDTNAIKPKLANAIVNVGLSTVTSTLLTTVAKRIDLFGFSLLLGGVQMFSDLTMVGWKASGSTLSNVVIDTTYSIEGLRLWMEKHTAEELFYALGELLMEEATNDWVSSVGAYITLELDRREGLKSVTS